VTGACIQCAWLSLTSAETVGWECDVTGFGSFVNSTYKTVLDLLELGDLRLGQVVIKRVAVVELGVNSGSGDGKGCQGMDGTAKFTNIVIAGFGRDEIWSEKVTSRLSGVK